MKNPWPVALTHPLNLCMLALSLAAGLGAAWWLFPLGLLFWAVMLLVSARDPGLRIRHTLDTRAPMAQRFQVSFDRIEALQVKVYNSLGQADPAVQRALQPVQDQVNALTDQAYQLALRSTALENYRLVSTRNTSLEEEWVRLNQQASTAADPTVQRELKGSIASLEGRLSQQRQAQTQLDRVEALLTSLANALESVLVEILRLQTQGLDQVRQKADTLLQSLQKQSADLKFFEKDQ